MIKGVIFISFVILILTGFVRGQYSNIEAERKSDAKTLERLENQTAPLPKTKRFYGNKLTKEQKERITPSKAAFVKYKDFLKAPGTGIVKILPFPNCHPVVVDAGDSKCARALPIIGNGSQYSFYRESHTDFSTSNLSFSNNNFSVEFRSNLVGLIADLGVPDINSVTLDTAEIKSLTSFPPSRRYSEVLKQTLEFKKGSAAADGKIYTTEAPVRLDHVYAIRTVNYYRVRYFSWVNLYDDLTLVFQVVDIDADGALTLIWKTLKKNSKVEIPA